MREDVAKLTGMEVDEEGRVKMLGYDKYVQIKLVREGFHRWLEAPDEVAHLRNYHRHLFHIRIQISLDSDREIEYYLFQKKVEEIIKFYISRQPDFTNEFDWEEFYELTGQGIDEDVLVINSCENFAEHLVYQLESEYGANRSMSCLVSEDDENGSIVSNFN